MKKIDFKKELKQLYNAPKAEPVMLEVPQMNFLMIDGEGDPNAGGAFTEATEALYALSYALKFMVKRGEHQVDYGVLPLEGLWWVDDMSKFSIERKDEWKWTLMIMQPDFIGEELVARAKEEVRRKKNPTALDDMRFDAFDEGRVAQIMHVGPYAEEAPIIRKLHDFIVESGSKLRGKHHEIYLGDPRRSAPEKLKTIIRQPLV